jgi:DNA-binding HxlR family transcriptional regulator
MTIHIDDPKSGCPINLTLQALGDRWSLVILRDIMFGNRRHFRELLARSDERIASNILADRLKKLTAMGFLTRQDDPSHKQKAIYSLTGPAIELLPVFAQIGAWGRKHLPTTPEFAIRAQLLEEGGPPLWADFMTELRHDHLGEPLPAGHASVLARLTAAYEALAEPAPAR